MKKLKKESWTRALNWLETPSKLDEVENNLSSRSMVAINEHALSLISKIDSVDTLKNKQKLYFLLREYAYKNGKMRSFSAFQNELENGLGGIVFTAHPTFSLSKDARALYHNQLLKNLGKEVDEEITLKHVHAIQPPTLEEELEQTDVAVLAVRQAIRTANEITLKVARELYPEDWRSFNPSFLTVASWVGFDLDGRTDIDWSKSLHFRYLSALKAVDELERQLSLIKSQYCDYLIEDIESGLSTFRECFQSGMSALSDKNKKGLASLNKLAVKNLERKEVAILKINNAFDNLLSSVNDDDILIDVALLNAEWKNLRLGLAHIHFRLNAVQLHNAIRSDINLEREPDNSASRRKYLAEITKLLDTVKPAQVHYGTLAQEQTTARRLFMLAAQFEKHFDNDTPIRLLVAESDTPFTLLTALYYARLFGVDDHVEISPLFETAIGLKRGDHVIKELLDNEHFLSYIKKQKRFCVQLGFSDSGRYIGQPAATLAIERFKLRLIRLWQSTELTDVALVFFDTHGESIGRGAHPNSLKERFLYTHSPETRKELVKAGIPYKHEVSFQGGDGYLWFQSEETTLGVITDFLETRLKNFLGNDDPFYKDSSWSLDFFLTLKEFQDQLEHHEGYVRLIDGIAPNFLYATGSRASRRQGSGVKTKALEHVGQVRAIPHNAMLQQMGYMVNVLGGCGTAIQRAPERFSELLSQSDRLRTITNLILSANSRSDVKSLNAYIELLNPEYWIDILEGETDEHTKALVMALSETMEFAFKYQELNFVTRKLRRDANYFSDALTSHGQLSKHKKRESTTLTELHDLRLSLIQFIYLKAMLIPAFSTQTGVSLDELVISILSLDIPDTLTELRAIFPAISVEDQDDLYGEQSTYEAGHASDYGYEEREIFSPIENAYNKILTISGIIALEVGAFG
tara:strand:- start:448 stop:3201 length:2754 start_codon:yes stop_codon:yes gene_type:complete